MDRLFPGYPERWVRQLLETFQPVARVQSVGPAQMDIFGFLAEEVTLLE
jgi:hypothetical protein